MRIGFYKHIIYTGLLIMSGNLYSQFGGNNLFEFQAGNLPGSDPRRLVSNYNQLNLNYRYRGLCASGRVEYFIFTFGNKCDFCRAIGNDTEKKVNQVYGKRDDFQALGIDTWDGTSTAAIVGEFRQHTGITYPLLLRAGAFEALYKTSYDKVLIVDKQGILRHKTPSDRRTQDDLDNAVAVIDGLFTATGIVDPGDVIHTGLQPVFPNPSPEHANLHFRIEFEGMVDIRMYNSLGKQVKQVVGEILPAGRHRKQFSTAGLSNGIYFIRMNAGGQTFTRKMQVIK
jgi:hypothetical protein